MGLRDRLFGKSVGKSSEGHAEHVIGDHTVLGEMMSKSPALKRYIERRVASKLSIVPVSPVKAVGKAVTFSLSGEEGQVLWVKHNPQCLFRGSELFAQDDSESRGHGTAIVNVTVGSESWSCRGSEIPTWMFYEWIPPEDRAGYEALAGLVRTSSEIPGVKEAAVRLRLTNAAASARYPTCQTGLEIAFEVRFLKTCRFEAVLWGRAIPW